MSTQNEQTSSCDDDVMIIDDDSDEDNSKSNCSIDFETYQFLKVSTKAVVQNAFSIASTYGCGCISGQKKIRTTPLQSKKHCFLVNVGRYPSLEN